MANLLLVQYSLIIESRQVVFQFLQERAKDQLNTPLETFNGKTIGYLYLHIANTYIAWAANFALGDDIKYFDQEEKVSLIQLRSIFESIDEMMYRFSNSFVGRPETPVKGFKWPEKYIETNAFGIFTHVISHEFHHKGQAMTMARLLGHIPPDTDIMRF